MKEKIGLPVKNLHAIFRAASYLLLLILLLPQPVRGQPASPLPRLFKDINTRTSDRVWFGNFMEFGGCTYVFASLSDGPIGLIKTDGTPEHTKILKAGLYGSVNSPDPTWAVYQGKLYFPAFEREQNVKLWRSDGTAEGTVPFVGFPTSEYGPGPSAFVEMDGILYFVFAHHLWRTDGTVAGTWQVGDGTENIQSSMLPYRGHLYFNVWTANREVLWCSDGTQAGTGPFTAFAAQPMKTIYPLLVHEDILYLSADDGIHGMELWVTDGSDYGGRLFADLNPAGSSDPIGLLEFASGLVFMALDEAHGAELWWTPGMSAGGQPIPPQLVADVWPGEGYSEPGVIGILDSRLLFIAGEASGVRGLYTWVGPPASAERVETLVPQVDAWDTKAYIVFQEKIYFLARDAAHGSELWVTDGRPGGTQLAVDFWPGPFSGGSKPFSRCGERLCFAADDGDHGVELWSSDGTPQGSTLLIDLNTARPGSSFFGQKLISAGPLFYFTAYDGVHGTELWHSDGTEEGTFLVRDISQGEECGATPDQQLTPVGPLLYFIACENSHRVELWATDGQPGSAWRVADRAPGISGFKPNFLTPAGDRLFFTAWEGGGKQALYSVKAGSTVQRITDLPGEEDGKVTRMQAVGQRIIYIISADTGHYELWQVDASTSSVRRLFDEMTGFGSMQGVEDGLYFTGLDLNRQDGLWRLDFTTQEVRRLNLSSLGREGLWDINIHNLNNTLIGFAYFNSQAVLFRLNEQSGLPEPVRAFPEQEWRHAARHPLRQYGRQVIFMVEGQDGLIRFFRSDGTTAGTQPLPGEFNMAQLPVAVGPYLFVTAAGAAPNEQGYELWAWEGLQKEPRLVADLLPGMAESFPDPLLKHDNRLFFFANDGIHGRELWVYEPPIKQIFYPVVYR